MWLNENTYRGESGEVLLLCSNRLSTEHYGREFARFISRTNGVPQRVIDNEDPPAGDNRVSYRVSDSELLRFYQESSVFYTPAEEPRHLLYSPIEANIVGIPLVFHANSLLGRLVPSDFPGRVESADTARKKVRELMNMTPDARREFGQRQKLISQHFRSESLIDDWRRGMHSLESRLQLIRAAEPDRYRTFLFDATRNRAHTQQEHGLPPVMTSRHVIDFREKWPNLVDVVSGISFGESFGRWSEGKKLSLGLVSGLPRYFSLTIEFQAYGPNVSRRFLLVVGNRKYPFVVGSGEMASVVIPILNHTGGFDLRIDVPRPTQPQNDSRRVGIGIRRIIISPCETREELRRLHPHSSPRYRRLPYLRSLLSPARQRFTALVTRGK